MLKVSIVVVISIKKRPGEILAKINLRESAIILPTRRTCSDTQWRGGFF
jgi:hypothetical protein